MTSATARAELIKNAISKEQDARERERLTALYNAELQHRGADILNYADTRRRTNVVSSYFLH